MADQKCADRIASYWASREADLYRFHVEGSEEYEGEMYEYGLSFDYVAAHTFDDQPEGYWRYQFSWGGPSDELRFYHDGSAQYWFLDWFDGASLDVTDSQAVQATREWFEDGGIMDPRDAAEADRESAEYCD